eukprot:TRINITY_DN23750_c0_g2_i1.p1 TRINITY_DN23750_c0_g2~~TRINITY_DN23750_c0_g2_i1.p1  ORF type:complete len:585 (-),score=49.05 TRINITY_DN23750_c0_g2_i1:176-1930(-)
MLCCFRGVLSRVSSRRKREPLHSSCCSFVRARSLWLRCCACASLPIRSERSARERFHSRNTRPWSEQRIAFERLLARLHHPRVRDLAWIVGNPGLLSGGDPAVAEHVWTDELALGLFGDDLHDRLLELDKDPADLLSWLEQASKDPRARLVGIYNEALHRYAFERLANVDVVLANEPIPKKSTDTEEPKVPAPRPVGFKPPRVSSAGIEWFCKVLGVSRSSCGSLSLRYYLHRGKTDELVAPQADDAILEYSKDGVDWIAVVATQSEETVSRAAESVKEGDSKKNGEVGQFVYFGVPLDVSLRFRYGSKFSMVDLCAAPGLPDPPSVALLGEVDFVLRQILGCGSYRFIHIEIAVKFYCASRLLACDWDDFIAPNPHDILGGKLRRMLNHQLKMGRCPYIRRKLAQSDPTLAHDEQEVEEGKVMSAMSMNGRLFYHATSPLDAPMRRPELWHERVAILSQSLEVGWWCYLRDLRVVLPRVRSDIRCVILRKPYWLAPLAGVHQLIEADHGKLRTCEELVSESFAWQKFQYIAVLQQCGSQGSFEELCRGFVLPNAWPHVKGRGKIRERADSASSNGSASRPGIS